MSETDTIKTLQDDIVAAMLQITFQENRIWRAQLAIDEILRCREARADEADDAIEKESAAVAPAKSLFYEKIESLLPHFSGRPFRPIDLKKIVSEKLPELGDREFYNALANLKFKGIIMRQDYGLYVASAKISGNQAANPTPKTP